MDKIFDTLIDSFLADRVGVAAGFIDEKLSADLQHNLALLHSGNLLLPAGTGNNAAVHHDKAVRSDVIYWLDRGHNNTYENAFFDLIDRFVAYLNRTCYTGITSYEFHYARYEKGSFYKKHLDQFRTSDSRQYSMILYLNPGWRPADGGELCIHHSDHLQNIPPLNGKMVFFKSSELIHEVLLAHKPRMSITGWLRID